jgi:hypothetical protein
MHRMPHYNRFTTAAKPEMVIQADIRSGSLTNNWTYISEEKEKDGNFPWIGTEANTFKDGHKLRKYVS